MKKNITIYLILISMTVFSQNKKSLEGYYNLSEFEMAARLFLLDNNTFYYSAIFGSVDLEIYGTYSIENNSIKFQPKEEQIQPFALYGRHNKTLTNQVEFYYYKPDEDGSYEVVFALDNDWVKHPVKEQDENRVYFKVKHQQPKTLKIGYPALFSKTDNFFRVGQVSKATVPSKNNDFILTYNRYYNMRKQFSNSRLQLKGDSLISGDKTIQRQDLQEGEREKIVTFFDEYKMFEPSIVVKEKPYKKIALTLDSSSPLLEPKSNGILKEIVIEPVSNIKPINIENWKTINKETYTISYPKNWTTKTYEDEKIDYILSPDEISGVEILISEGTLEDIEAYVKKWKTKINNRVPNNGLTAIKNKLPNTLVYEMKFVDQLKGLKVIKRFYYKNNTIINVNIVGDDKNKAVISKILETFELK